MSMMIVLMALLIFLLLTTLLFGVLPAVWVRLRPARLTNKDKLGKQ